MADKLTKAEVNYRDARINATQYCGNCSMFRDPGRYSGHCTLVEGRIMSGSVCDRWDAKKAATA